MVPKIVCSFSNIDDAKNAFGQIKKESWNQTQLAVIFTGIANPSANDAAYEFGDEAFYPEKRDPFLIWPGVQEKSFKATGEVFVGSNFENTAEEVEQLLAKFSAVQQQLKAHKVVTMAAVTPELAQRVREIFECNGAEIIEDPIDAK